MGGVGLILTGLASLRGFPQAVAAPFQMVAGALLLPPVWSGVIGRWPSLSKQSTAVRTATCALAFLVLPLIGVFNAGMHHDSSSQSAPSQLSSYVSPPLETKKEKIEKLFSAWDGSLRTLEKTIKKSMNDPSSYEHVETVYWDRRDHLVVRTTFRGKNAFGAMVKNSVKAKVDLQGNVIEVVEQIP